MVTPSSKWRFGTVFRTTLKVLPRSRLNIFNIIQSQKAKKLKKKQEANKMTKKNISESTFIFIILVFCCFSNNSSPRTFCCQTSRHIVSPCAYTLNASRMRTATDIRVVSSDHRAPSTQSPHKGQSWHGQARPLSLTACRVGFWSSGRRVGSGILAVLFFVLSLFSPIFTLFL